MPRERAPRLTPFASDKAEVQTISLSTNSSEFWRGTTTNTICRGEGRRLK